ncbi:MAG: antibiotic biosynthesis monooxygenase [Anaerolineales bacterium]|nr:antibiotic biosynthesis monooxygenase [Anaerolineales bacterium]
MYLILWEYHVKLEAREKFEQIYSPTGAWAELFQNGAGYLGTELLLDETDPQKYLTIDLWVSKEAYESFLERWKQEYEMLDKQCAGLTKHEVPLGKGHLLK